MFAVVVGLPVAAFGAGIGIRYLTKTGLTGTSVLGVFTLLAGLTLLGYAGAVFWRLASRWQRLWFIPVVPVALLMLFSVAEGTMLAYAPRNDLGAATPAASGLAYRDVTFRTSDGVRLSAWLIPSANHAAVVTLPGAGSNRTATLAQATVLARHGYGVLMVDPRGQGRSGGDAMDAGWYGDRDVTAAVTFLQRQPGVDPSRVGVVGMSMGGEEAIGASAADTAIRAVVAEGATHRTAADKAGYLPGGVAGAIQRGMDWLSYGTAAVLSPAPQPGTLHSAIARARSTAFLLIAGGDAVDEPEAVAYLRGAAPDRVQTWTVPGASHVHGLGKAPTEWTARVTTFLDRTLGVTRAVTAAAVTRPMLHIGDRGPAVVLLQQRLITLHYWDVDRADGVFGPATLHGVVAFQKVQRIARDGVVGPVTWAKLDRPVSPAPRHARSTSSVEVDLSRQVGYLVRAGAVRGVVDVSTGSGGLYRQSGSWHRAVTPTGLFRIESRRSGWQLSPLGWMYRPHYFSQGYAIHGSTSVPPYAASHGCIRVTVATMNRLAPQLWIGMPFAVYAG